MSIQAMRIAYRSLEALAPLPAPLSGRRPVQLPVTRPVLKRAAAGLTGYLQGR
jgi:hypothetical protein